MNWTIFCPYIHILLYCISICHLELTAAHSIELSELVFELGRKCCLAACVIIRAARALSKHLQKHCISF